MTVECRSSHLLAVYARRDVPFVSGHGCYLIDETGRSFLDFGSGIGVNALGYGHPAIEAAVARALGSGLVHTSNLYRTAAGEALAEHLSAASFAEAVFFCNSGTEATEAAIKFARRTRGGRARTDIVAARGSFHGRTTGALALTDRPAWAEPFAPLLPGARFIDLGDREPLAAIDPERTAALIVEPVQGEGGVVPVDASVLAALRQWCDETGVLLVFDEVQCGLGRTGTLFAYQQTGVTPDILLLAKPLAGGLPMGAVLVNERVAAAIRPGDHASTFGGGPLVSAVALAVLNTIDQPAFLAQVGERGRVVANRLQDLVRTRPRVRTIRGRGLMWGVVVEGDAGNIVTRAYEAGLLLLTARRDVVRLLPPLVISADDLERGLALLREVV